MLLWKLNKAMAKAKSQDICDSRIKFHFGCATFANIFNDSINIFDIRDFLWTGGIQR